MKVQSLNIEETRSTLLKSIGTQIQIMKRNSQTVVGYIRGFADEKRNIVLLSATSDSLMMSTVIELKNINGISMSY